MNFLVNAELKEIMIDSGVLHEANRTFFHPLGLALGIRYYDDSEKTELIMMQDVDEEGTVYKYLDKFKMEMFREFASKKYELREEKLGFIIQVKDCDDEEETSKNNKTIKTERLDIVFKYLNMFFYEVQHKFIKHHEKADIDNTVISRSGAENMLAMAVEDNDWESVAAWAMILKYYDKWYKEISSLEMRNSNV